MLVVKKEAESLYILIVTRCWNTSHLIGQLFELYISNYTVFFILHALDVSRKPRVQNTMETWQQLLSSK